MGVPRLIAKLSNLKSSSTFDEDKNTNWHSYDSWLVRFIYFVLFISAYDTCSYKMNFGKKAYVRGLWWTEFHRKHHNSRSMFEFLIHGYFLW